MGVLEYMAALDVNAAKDMQGYHEDVVPYKFESPEDCIQCLVTLSEHGISLHYLFGSPKVWGIYLRSISDERYHKAIELLLELGQPSDLVDYLCLMYKCGTSVIPDVEYDALENLYIATYPGLGYLKEQTPDDAASRVNSKQNTLVTEAVKLSSVKSAKISPMSLGGAQTDSSNPEYASLNAEKSTSIRPVRSYEEAYDFIKSAPDCRTHWSLKLDGINTKCMCKDGKLALALSRGRATDSWDYTEAIRRVLAIQSIDVDKLNGKVTGESLVDPNGLEILRSKYSDKEYKSPKSAAGAMLRAPQKFDIEDYKWLRFYPFEIEEVRKDEAFARLREAGFKTPPELMFEMSDIPRDTLDDFSTWLDTCVFEPLWGAEGVQQNMTDGVVLQLLTDIENDRADKYSDLNIALKFSHWSEQEYTSVVTDIKLEQQRVYMSVVLEIAPVVTRDMNTATRVSVGSSAILVKDNVRVGDKIRFARKSEAINIYLGKVVD